MFVKMHEIIMLDDEQTDSDPGVITVPLDPKQLERGFDTILENLEMERAFKIEKKGRDKFNLNLVDPSSIPTWLADADKPRPTPEGVFTCAHCGRYFPTEMQRNLHQKLHYIV